jgi:hypothetical protein
MDQSVQPCIADDRWVAGADVASEQQGRKLRAFAEHA